MKTILIILSSLIGYLFGSINTSLVVGVFYKKDIREHGSGNAGLTNALRVLGKKAAVLVLVGDVLKGVLACALGFLIFKNTGLMAAGVGAVLGHNWPLYFNFKGGKGVLISASVLFMMDFRIGLFVLGLFILVVAITRYVSLGSILGAASFPVISIIQKKDPLFIIFSFVIMLLIVIRHRSNIDRILKGKENKLSLKKH